ncbi:hypothetical protein RCL1_007142 [Eukaryota sp. TZLM3-RCL]
MASFKKRTSSTHKRKEPTLVSSENTSTIDSLSSAEAPTLNKQTIEPPSKRPNIDTVVDDAATLEKITSALRSEAQKDTICSFSLGKPSSSAISTKTELDMQPHICKDWMETGFCGYGDNCKFAHIRLVDESEHTKKLHEQLRSKRALLQQLNKKSSTTAPTTTVQQEKDKIPEEQEATPLPKCSMCSDQKDLFKSKCGCVYCLSCSKLTEEGCFSCGSETGVFTRLLK